MTTIEKALEANKTAGNTERITIDGVTFTRFPLHEAVLCVYEGYDKRYADIAKATEAAIQAKAHLETSGMSWEEIAKTFSASDPLHCNIHGQIWSKYDSTLKLFGNVFHNAPEDNSGLWSIPDDYIAIYPRDASHLLVAEYFPTPDDVKYLKRCGYVRYDHAGHPGTMDTYFLNTEWNPETMAGILKV